MFIFILGDLIECSSKNKRTSNKDDTSKKTKYNTRIIFVDYIVIKRKIYALRM